MAEMVEVGSKEVSVDGKNEEDTGGLSSELTLFVDKHEVLLCIGEIIADVKAFEIRFEHLEKLLGKYQEQPTLLNSALDEMITPMTSTLLSMILADEANKWKNICENTHFDALCKVIQLICKVRGFKHVVKLFPHEVSHLEPVLSILLHSDRKDYATWETRFILLLWLNILCLIPFDICSMDSTLQTITLTSDQLPTASDSQSSILVNQIVNVCKLYLSDTGPTREASSSCLSALLTRPDMDSGLLTDFIHFGCQVLDAWVSTIGDTPLGGGNLNSFQLIGVLHCLCQIFKKGHRSRLLEHTSAVLERCERLNEQSNQTTIRKFTSKLVQRVGMTFLPPRVSTWRYSRGSRSLLQNLGGNEGTASAADATQEAPDEEDDPVEEGDVEELETIISVLLTLCEDSDTVVRWSAAKGMGRVTMRLCKASADDVVGAVFELFQDRESDSSWHGGCLAVAELTRRGLLLPERLTEFAPILVDAINYDVMRGQHSVGAHVRDAACYVCWAFARAYSPQVMRPYIQELSGSMLITALYDREINCRRAASAAFQENVGRQGNENFPNGIDIIGIADYFALGNRPAAYVSLAPQIAAMDDNLHEVLMDHLLGVKIAHWDSEIRVLASRGLAALVPLNPTRSLEALEAVIQACFSANVLTRHGSLLSVGTLLLALRWQGTPLSEELRDSVVSLVPKLEKARLFRGRGAEILRQASCTLLANIARAHLEVPLKTRVLYVEFLNENSKHPQEYISQSAADALRQVLYSYFNGTEAPSDRLQALSVLKYMQGLSTEDNVAATRGYAFALGTLPERLLVQPEGRLTEILTCLAESASTSKLVMGEPDAETRRNCVNSAVEIVEKLSLSTSLTAAHVERVMSILLAASDDRSVDKRGDTGSWSRIIALKGMERLAHCCHRGYQATAQQPHVITSYGPACRTPALSTPPGDGEYKAECSYIQFPVSSLGYTYASKDGSTKQGCTLLMDALVIDIPPSTANIWTTTSSEGGLGPDGVSLFEQMVKVMLRQLSEKLDMVRQVSGGCLVRLLQVPSTTTYADIPHRDVLMDVFQDNKQTEASGLDNREEGDAVNWLYPNHVFPLLARILPCRAYFHDIFSGLVISIGGLSETVVKESSSILLQFCRQYCSKKQTPSVKDDDSDYTPLLISSMSSLFSIHKGDDRVIVPLLKTLNLLLKHGILEALQPHNSPFFPEMITIIASEMESSNLVKIKLCIDTLVYLLQISDPIRGSAYKKLVVLLGHKYPRVRKYASEQLYIQFLSDRNTVGISIEEAATRAVAIDITTSSAVENVYCGLAPSVEASEKAQDLLVTTAWDGPVKEVRAVRQEVCDICSLVMGKKEKKEGDNKGKNKVVHDELDSYASLVQTAGY